MCTYTIWSVNLKKNYIFLTFRLSNKGKQNKAPYDSSFENYKNKTNNTTKDIEWMSFGPKQILDWSMG